MILKVKVISWHSNVKAQSFLCCCLQLHKSRLRVLRMCRVFVHACGCVCVCLSVCTANLKVFALHNRFFFFLFHFQCSSKFQRSKFSCVFPKIQFKILIVCLLLQGTDFEMLIEIKRDNLPCFSLSLFRLVLNALDVIKNSWCYFLFTNSLALLIISDRHSHTCNPSTSAHFHFVPRECVHSFSISTLFSTQ